MVALVVVAYFTLWGVVVSESVDYNQAQMVRLSNVSSRNLEELVFMENLTDFEILTVNKDSIDIMVLNKSMLMVDEELADMNMSYKILVNNVQDMVNKEPKATMENKTTVCDEGLCITWDKYYRLNSILNYLDYLKMTYPKYLAVETIGYSEEKRPLRLAKVTSGGKKKMSKKSVWVDGGIHAREWVTPSAALYILHEVLSSLDKDGSNSTFSGLDFYILPVVNPDGYEYSHTTDRFWRKNRSANKGSRCKGTDLNRNWSYKWAGPESWGDPCHMNYRGAHAFSELETIAMSRYLLNKTGEIKAYLSLHSYGQNVLFPWAYSYTRPSDYKELYELAYYMAYQIKTDNKAIYRYGGAAETYYIASGGSQDWAKAAAKIKYAYTMELRDMGEFMFSLPPSEILEASKDAFAAFTVLTQKIKN